VSPPVRLHVTTESSGRVLIASIYRDEDGATWQTTRRLLHSRRKTVYDKAERAKLNILPVLCHMVNGIVTIFRTSWRRQLQVCLPSDRTTDQSCHRFSLHWQSTKSDGYCLQSNRSHRRSTYCRVRCWSHATMSLHQSSPHLLTCRCSREVCFLLQESSKVTLLKKPGIEVRRRRTTGQSRTCLQSPRLSRGLCWLACVHVCQLHQFQSAYRKGHSTATALLEVRQCVYTAANDKQVTVLIGLDLSAAFDTVNHGILLERVQSEFGVTGTPLAWLQSYR